MALRGKTTMLKLYDGDEVEAQFDDRSVGRFAYHWHEFPASDWDINPPYDWSNE